METFARLQRDPTALPQPPQPDPAEEFEGRVPQIVNQVVSAPGRPLGSTVREAMEFRFGTDFSSIKVHTDPLARESAEAVRAQAYTVNDDIVFGRTAPSPESRPGQELLAHELAHVVQRRQMRPDEHAQPRRADHDAHRVATEYSASDRPLRVGRMSPGLLARQQIPGSHATSPTVVMSTESGRTIILLNGVAIAETHVDRNDIRLEWGWTSDRMGIRITVPEGRDIFLIRSAQTTHVLQAAATRYRVEVGSVVTMPDPKGELESQQTAPPSFRATDSLSGERPKPPTRKPSPPRKDSAPPPKAAEPQTTPDQASTAPPVQLFRPATPSLDLSPEAKYGKPQTDKEVAEERIKGVIRDAMAGKPGIPPPIAGVDKASLLDLTKRLVVDAVRPLIRTLPKDMQALVLDKLDSAVESGVKAALESALDASKLDPTTKGAILRAADAWLRVK